MRSYRTISPLPAEAGGLFLLHCPSAFAARVLPGTLPGGVRTFLWRERQRPPGPPGPPPSITGTVHGRTGSFAVHHVGVMDRGAQRLVITVIPDSGTGDFAGITGTMTIEIKGGAHYYTLDYTLP